MAQRARRADGHCLGIRTRRHGRTPPHQHGPSGRRTLGVGSGEWGVVDSRGGASFSFAVGPAAEFFLLEGDFTGRTLVAADDELPEETLVLEMSDVQLAVTTTD